MVRVDHLAVVLSAAVFAAASALPAVGDRRIADGQDETLKCERYNASCIAEAAARGTSKAKCIGVEHCANRDAHYCIATWSPVKNGTAASADDGHPSGHQGRTLSKLNLYSFRERCAIQQYMNLGSYNLDYKFSQL